VERALGPVTRYPHARHPTLILDDTRHLRPHAEIGAGLRGGICQDRIEQRPAHRRYPPDVARLLWNRREVLEILLADVHAAEERRAGGADLLGDAETLQKRQCLRLKDMRRQDVPRKRRPLYHRDAQTLAREQRR
jgi:hypothetical protein